MPIKGEGWEIHIKRVTTQKRASDGLVRTVGTYQVYHDGIATHLSGQVAESGGPSNNDKPGSKKRILPGRYPLWTQDGTKYDTIGYVENEATNARPKPGIELGGTEPRKEILIHPGVNGFLSSVGCINLCTNLPNAEELISYPGSRKRVIALIEDMKAYAPSTFPKQNSKRIPNAWAVLDGEP